MHIIVSLRRRRTDQNRAFQSLSPPLVLHLVAVVQPAKTIRDEIHEIGRSAGEMAGTHISFLLLLYARFQLGGDTSNVGGAAGLSLQNIFTDLHTHTHTHTHNSNRIIST